MNLNKNHVIIICFLFISCGNIVGCVNSNNRSSKTIDEKFLGVWVSIDVQSFDNRKPNIADTSDELFKKHSLIIKKADTINSYNVDYESSIGGAELFVTEDDNTLVHSLKPFLDAEIRIKYIDSNQHLIYDWEDDPTAGHEFIKLK